MIHGMITAHSLLVECPVQRWPHLAGSRGPHDEADQFAKASDGGRHDVDGRVGIEPAESSNGACISSRRC
jgi:hypothetical protein